MSWKGQNSNSGRMGMDAALTFKTRFSRPYGCYALNRSCIRCSQSGYNITTSLEIDITVKQDGECKWDVHTETAGHPGTLGLVGLKFGRPIPPNRL
jgi:hypothetical protein